MTYSIVETAKENGLNPYQYLMYIFEKLPNEMRVMRTPLIGFLKPDFLLLSKMSRHIQIPVPPINILYFLLLQFLAYARISILPNHNNKWYSL
ncbi:Uncharacterised protein [Mycobacteroides abscessus subsp. abscessus]|nr:Uncharacterised protein [Mycobacteroides abscessus subsp. abscessus]